MRASIQIKADILKTLMIEDRKEIRDIRSMIYKSAYILAALSFALSAFLLEKKTCLNAANISILTDALMILLIWTFFVRLKLDLQSCRRCLVRRQYLIMHLDESDTSDLDPFTIPELTVPDVSDSELKWIPALATALIFLKMLMILFMGSPSGVALPGVWARLGGGFG